jgi:hypothetical protein
VFLVAGKQAVMLEGPRVKGEEYFFLENQQISKVDHGYFEDYGTSGFEVTANAHLRYTVAIHDFDDEVHLAEVRLGVRGSTITSTFTFAASESGDGVAQGITITAFIDGRQVDSTKVRSIEVRPGLSFGGPEEDEGYPVQQTQDGGYILVGDTYSYGAGESDIWLIKTDSSGELQWDRTFGGWKSDHGRSVKQTSDGGYIIAGFTESYAIGENDVWLIKTDSEGNLDWEKTFGGSNWDAGYSVQQTQDGGYIITGYTWSYGAGCDDVWLIKTDSNGNKEWDKAFGSPNSEGGNSVQQTQDGGYFITGYEGGKTLNVWLIKTDSQGNLIWDKAFGGSDWDCGYSGKQISDGGYIITGYTDESELVSRHLWLIKTDSQGELEWDKTFSSSGLEDVGYSVEQTRDGGYIVAGRTLSSMACDQCWLIKTDSSGNLEWDRIFGGGGYDWGRSVQQTSDGGYVIVGHTDSYGAGSAHKSSVWLIKVSSMNTPNQPECSSPRDGLRNVSLTATLKSGPFSDPDSGDIHVASQWQIREATGDYSNPIFDSGIDTFHLTQIGIPPGTLNYFSTYFWRVRYQDSQGVWSDYSSETMFTTEGGATPEAGGG